MSPQPLVFVNYGVCPLCHDCKHLDEASANPPKCAAFPDGIPDKFWNSAEEHRQPEPGDHGLQYEPREK